MLYFAVRISFLWLRARQSPPWRNAASRHRPLSVCPNVAPFRCTDHDNKHDDGSRKSNKDRRRKQHLSQRGSKLR
jgi:hypothetical protein